MFSAWSKLLRFMGFTHFCLTHSSPFIALYNHWYNTSLRKGTCQVPWHSGPVIVETEEKLASF